MKNKEKANDNQPAIKEIVEVLNDALERLDELKLHIAGAHVSYAIEFLKAPVSDD